MARPQNSSTPFIRQCISLWMADNKNVPNWSTPLITSSLCYDRKLFTGMFEDEYPIVSKAVSNELARLEKKGMLVSREGCETDPLELRGLGRPAKVFTRFKIMLA